MAKNPTRPDESPIKVETAGGWTGEYTNYTNPNPPKPQMAPFGRRRNNVVEYNDINEYQKPKTPEALEDKRFEEAIQRDLQNRNLKQPKPTE